MSAKECWESLNNVLAIPSSLSRSYSTFPLYSWTTLIEIAVYMLRCLLNINVLQKIKPHAGMAAWYFSHKIHRGQRIFVSKAIAMRLQNFQNHKSDRSK